MTREEFRRLGHQVVDRIADYREHVASLPVMSRAVPGAIKAQLPSSPPTDPENFADIFRDFDAVILPGLSHWQHPRFFGYFPSNGELASVLGDYLSTGLGVLGLSWQSSPALTEVEEVVTDWMRQMVGLSPAWDGGIQDSRHPPSGRHQEQHAIVLGPEGTAWGIATSGLGGRSLTRGVADAATIVAADASLADAAATAVANASYVEHSAVIQKPAEEMIPLRSSPGAGD